jgi:hemoglobin/transferrin/lactoferrin receptor protein
MGLAASLLMGCLHAGGPARAAGVEDTVTVLKPITVEAERSVTPTRQTATAVRLNRAAVSRFLPGSSGDALLAVPGVDLVKMGPWASRISLRGLSGDRVLVMVDGVRVNTVRGHGAQGSLVSVDRLDAVELLPGATSAQFGSDAMGGVVNLVTHRSLFSGTPQLGASMTARGSDPGKSWKLSQRAQWRTSRFGLEVAAGRGGLESLVSADRRVPNSGFHDEEYSARAAYRLGDAVLDYEYAHEAAYDIGLPAFDDEAGATGTYPLQGRDLNRFELTLPGRGAMPDGRLLAVYQRFRTDFTEETMDSVFVRGNYVGTRSTTAADAVTSPAWSVRPELKLKGFGNVQLAGEYRLERTSGPRTQDVVIRNGSGTVTSDVRTRGESVPESRRDAWALSAFGAQQVFGNRLEAGLRYDALRSRADSTETSMTSRLDVTDRRLSVEGGVSRGVGPLEPYVHLATGFRAPNLQERYFNNDIHGGLRLFGNPDLEAERSRSYEAGVRLRDLWDERIREVRVSAYRSDIDDLITFEYIGQLYLIPRFQYVNVNRARIEGVELASGLRFGAWNVDLNAAFPRGIDRETGRKLTDAGTGRVTLDLGVPVYGLMPMGRVAFRARWNNAVTGVDEQFTRPSFTTGDVEASTVLGNTRVVMAVRNLWNAHYREPLSFIEEPGRTFSFLLRHDLNFSLSSPRRP